MGGGTKALKSKKQAGAASKKAPAAEKSVDKLPKEDALRMFSPGPRYWLNHAPDVKGMPAVRLQDEIAQIDEFLARQITSSPDWARLEKVRNALRAEAVTRGKGVARSSGAKQAKRPTAGQEKSDAGVPRILREQSSIATEDPSTHVSSAATLTREYDEIVAYLQRNDVPAADRKLLRTELANLTPLVAEELGRRSAQRHAEVVNTALTPGEGEPGAQIVETARRIDSIRPLPDRPGLSVLYGAGEAIVMTDEEAGAIRASMTKEMKSTGQRIWMGTEQVQDDYNEFVHRTFDEHPYVGGLSMLASWSNPLDWEEDILARRAAANFEVGRFKSMEADPWRDKSLVPLAEAIVSAGAKGDAAREYLDQHIEGVFKGTRRIITGLQVAKKGGQLASYTFTPGAAMLYAGVASGAEQLSEVHYGLRESVDTKGILLDMGAAYVGAKAGGLIPEARAGASLLERGGLWTLRDRTSTVATTATRMLSANAFEEGQYSLGGISGAIKDDLLDYKGIALNALVHHGSKYAHGQHARSKAKGQEAKAQEGSEQQSDQPKSQASATVLTQKPRKLKPLDLPVDVINAPKKAKGVGAEANVPFELYTGWEWNHIAGGEETSSSRVSIARESSTDRLINQARGTSQKTAGNDFLVEHVETDRLVIGEQKAVDAKEFTKATAITTSLEKNVANSRQRLESVVAEGRNPMRPEEPLHPDAKARLERTIERLKATEQALKNGTELPEGVVFEFTRVSGKGEQIGAEHVKNLAKAFEKQEKLNPGFIEHLLGRTFVRDPELARSKGRDPSGKRGTDADPDVVSAKDLLTPEARDTLERVRAGKTEKAWRKQKATEEAAKKQTEKQQAAAARKERSQQRKAEEDAARDAAKKRGEEVRDERLRQLKEERQQRNEPEPRTKRERERVQSRMKREADKAGREARDKAFEEFKQERGQREEEARSKRKADEQAKAEERAKQREAEKQAREQEQAEKKSVADEKKKAVEEARKAGEINEKGTLKTPESVEEMNRQATEAHRAEGREVAMGKAAHYANTAAAGLRAIDAFHDARDKGKSYVEASYEAGKTYLENTNPLIGAIGIAQSRMQKDEKGEQYYGDDAIDAWLGTIGETAGGYIVPGGGVDQLVNAGAKLTGAIDDHLKRGLDPNDPALKKANFRTVTDLAADVTPSRMFSQVLGGGLRSYYDIGKAIGGDTHGVEKFSDDAVKGKLGSVIQPWAMAADFAGNLASDDVGTALEKTVKKTEGTTLTKLGYASGDAMFDLGQNAEAKAGKHGTSVQGISMMLGMASDMIAGQSFEKALEKAGEAGKGSWADKVGGALGDVAFDTVEKAKDLLDEDVPKAKERLKQWWKTF